ncbi:hypothetical protein, partial [Paraglaciecola sp.]|uniref:hypothetical protein n=1 Tax=Paraglaciecola sp. TaxID=1920173 RepID=UPI003EF9EBCC
VELVDTLDLGSSASRRESSSLSFRTIIYIFLLKAFYSLRSLCAALIYVLRTQSIRFAHKARSIHFVHRNPLRVFKPSPLGSTYFLPTAAKSMQKGLCSKQIPIPLNYCGLCPFRYLRIGIFRLEKFVEQMTFWLLLSLFKSNWCGEDAISKTQWIAVNEVNKYA